jgi:hypothetical protein
LPPTYIALVPYDVRIPTEELLRVASALQAQATRDLGPIWGVAGVVSPFLRLEDVPVGYYPLVLMRELPAPGHGVHLANSYTPIGLVSYQADPPWSRYASHEMMEMLCDPFGFRTIAADRNNEAVQYLVEVCDPCEDKSYTINGVTVSDFVTPDFYGTSGGLRYSYTGSVTAAGQPVGKSYVSFVKADGKMYQDGAGAPLQPGQSADVARRWEPSPPAASPAPDQEVQNLSADVLDIERRLALRGQDQRTTRDKIHALVVSLADDTTLRTALQSDPESIAKVLHDAEMHASRTALKQLTEKLPSDYAYRRLASQTEAGAMFGDPNAGTFLLAHGSLFGT